MLSFQYAHTQIRTASCDQSRVGSTDLRTESPADLHGGFRSLSKTAGLTVVYCSLLRCDGVTVAKATAKGPVPTGIVATTLFLAVSITETVLSTEFVT
jgi:hypothetical protein